MLTLDVAVLALQIPSPYCPRTTGIEDVDNFDKLWTGAQHPTMPRRVPLLLPLLSSVNRDLQTASNLVLCSGALVATNPVSRIVTCRARSVTT